MPHVSVLVNFFRAAPRPRSSRHSEGTRRKEAVPPALRLRVLAREPAVEGGLMVLKLDHRPEMGPRAPKC